MTIPMRASLTAIGRQLQDDYLPPSSMPLPRELEELVAQLVALDTRKQRWTERSAKVLQFPIACPAPRD